MSFRAWGSSSGQNKFSHASYIGTGNKHISRGDDLKKKYRQYDVDLHASRTQLSNSNNNNLYLNIAFIISKAFSHSPF